MRELTVALAFVLVGCGEDGPPPDLRADVMQLFTLFDADPAPAVLEEVDRIADDRPVHAAEILEERGIPAAEEQLDTLEHAELTTSRGRTYGRRATRAYRDRVRALERYQAALALGASADPTPLLDAIRARREAEVALADLVHEMAEIAPRQPRPPQPPVDELAPEDGEGELEPPGAP
ncbi:MAG: hypothetical protein AB7S26_38115 [Sandaracinaceae bacterium]